MITKRIGLFALALAATAAIALGISSCGSEKDPLLAPNNGGVDRSKNPRVLDGDITPDVGASITASGEANGSRDDNGHLSLSGLTADGASAVTYHLDQPIEHYTTVVDVTFPSDGGGSLRYTANDASGLVQAQIDLTQTPPGATLTPTFTSPAAGGGQYAVTIYNNNGQAVNAGTFDISRGVNIIPDPGCIIKVNRVIWGAIRTTGQCSWTMSLPPCCNYSFQTPDGRIYPGNGVKVLEVNSQGVYVYLQTTTIVVSGNVASYVASASTGSY